MNRKKIVIIGAGPAGITAARELLREPEAYDVTLLEASDMAGGISRTVRHGENRIDIGGHRFFSKDERVMAWWQEVLPCQGAAAKDDRILRREARVEAGGPDPEETDDVFLIRHRVSRIYYRNHFFDYPISLKPETFLNMGFLTSMQAGFSYLGSCVRKLPETSLESFYINRFGRKLYSMFFEGYTEKLWGRHPREISADWGAQRVKGLSIWAMLKNILGKLTPGGPKKVETSLIEEFYYPKHGPGQLWEKALDMAVEQGCTVRYGARVTGLVRDGDRITAVVCEDGSRYEADEVISGMPLKELAAALPGMPAEVRAVAEGLPYRDFVTVGLLVDKLALQNRTGIPTLGNIVPDCWIYVQDTGVKLGRIQIFNNWSPYMLADPERTVWMGLEYFCDEGDEFWELSQEDCVKLAVEELRRIGVISTDCQILDSCRQKMPKAYPAYFDTYAQIDRLTDYLNGIENLCCVGRNGQHRYNNMDHSMVTAFVAADVIRGKAEKGALWEVNTEQEYHEEKKA